MGSLLQFRHLRQIRQGITGITLKVYMWCLTRKVDGHPHLVRRRTIEVSEEFKLPYPRGEGLAFL